MGTMKRKISSRMLVGLLLFIGVMFVVGGLLYGKLNALLREHVEEQVASQAKILADLSQTILDTELSSIRGISQEIEVNEEYATDILNVYEKNVGARENCTYGLLMLDGNVQYGEALSATEFAGIRDSFRGNEAVSYSETNGLLFTVPVFHQNNVKYVLYKKYSLESIPMHFSVNCFGGLGYVSIKDMDGKNVISSGDLELEQKDIWKDEIYKGVVTQLNEKLNVATAACVYEKIMGEEYYFYKADISWTGMSMVGAVPATVVAGGVKNIGMLVVWVFGLLMILFVVGCIYLMLSEQKIQESEELREAKTAADMANKAKSDFLANMSHEIRTPINGILGMDAMLLKECKDDELREYAKNIQSAGQSLLSIINDILDISKIESGKLELIPVKYDTFNVLNDCYNMTASRAKAKTLDFKMEIDPNIPSRLRGDEVRVRQIINNFLSNAVKYTKEGSITLKMEYENLEENQIQLIISVKDTGMGIKEEDIDKLFDSFTRIEEKKNRTIEGTGLGLNLTKTLVEMMGGEIYVESVYGEGSCFIAKIPQNIINPTPMGDFSTRYQEFIRKTEQKSIAFTAADAKILVVDDVEMNLKVVQGLLKETKVQIDLASSGKECIKLANEKLYDIIFLDHMMPVMDGIETLQCLRDQDEFINMDTPVVMLTANAIVGAREEYIDAGFTDYLSKPVQENELLAMILKYLPEHLVSKEVEKTEEVSFTNTEESETFCNKMKQIEDINVETGLSYCMNDETFYAEMIQEYVENNKIETLTQFFEEKDWENYRIVVHALKGTSMTIGAVQLSERAKSLEFAAKETNVEYIEENHKAVVEQYRSLLDVLEQVIASEV